MSATGNASDVRPTQVGPLATVTVRKLDELGVTERRAWDDLVGRCPGTDVTQLGAWGTVRSMVGYRTVYLLAYADDRLVGGALVLRKRVAGLISVGYLPYGPVIDPAAQNRSRVTGALVEALSTLTRSHSMIFVQPPEGAEDVSDALLTEGFRPSGAGIAPAGSYRLDLTRPLEEIRGGFSKRLKSWTNRWAAKGVTVRQGDLSDLPLLLELMEFTAARQHFTPPSLEYVSAMYRLLSAGGHAALFIGEVHGKAVSADLVTVAAGMVRGRLGGFDGGGEAGKLSVPAAVRWEIIKWAKDRGERYLDFGGLPEQMLHDMIDLGVHSSEDWPSAQRGKLAFNGTAFRYPMPVEYVRSPLVRRLYDFALEHPVGNRAVTFAKNLLRGNHGIKHPQRSAAPMNSADLDSFPKGDRGAH
jgi:lipid II:glycine glycyltransferase (peptidoglycan interpeptide bridge formation enzyme)